MHSRCHQMDTDTMKRKGFICRLVCQCVFVCSHHSSLPDDTHPVLDPGHAMRDLGEVLFAQSSLLGAEWTVLRGHDAQSVTGNRRRGISSRECIIYNTFRFQSHCVCVAAGHVLAQQAHEVVGCVGVEAERRDDDVGGGM